MIGWIALFAALILNATANSLLKAGSSSLKEGFSVGTIMQATTNPYLLGGVVLFALNVLCYIVALSKLPLSAAYPVMVIGGLFIVTTIAIVVFHESLSYLQALGLALVVFGTVLLYI